MNLYDAMQRLAPITLKSKNFIDYKRELFTRSNNDEFVAIQLMLGDAYGLTMGQYLDSGYDNIEEFFKARLGERYSIAKFWGYLK